MQPLDNSTIRSSGQLSMPQLFKISPSMPTSPNSLTITARRRPTAFSSTWWTSVVLLARRKPVTIVQGTLARDVISNLPSNFCSLDRERRNSRNRVLADVDGPFPPDWQPLGMGMVKPRKPNDVIGILLGVERAEHVSPFPTSRDRDRATARAV